jgi:hypothetical protein
MKKRLILSLAIALLLIATLALPAVAANEESVTGSVMVGETVSITLTDAGTTGINFGSVTANGTTYSDTDQSSGTPAIKVVVGAETNVSVDIGIKGSTTGSLTLDNWKYSTTFGGAQTSITTSYFKVYGPVGASSSSDFYHWVAVPALTAADTYTATISYKAVKTGTSF